MDGYDRLNGGAVVNTMHGENGDDFITATGNLNPAFGEANNDQLFFVGQQNQLNGGDGNDWLGVSGDNIALVGANGADWLGATGNGNTVTGQVGDDTVSGAARQLPLRRGRGDWVGISGNNYPLFGGAGADFVAATGNGNALDGGAGNDVLVAAAGHSNDTFVFHAGYERDTVQGFAVAGDVVNLETFGIANFATLQTYMSQVGSDVAIGLNGTDILTLQNVAIASLTAATFDLAESNCSDGDATTGSAARATATLFGNDGADHRARPQCSSERACCRRTRRKTPPARAFGKDHAVPSGRPPPFFYAAARRVI